MKVSRLFPALLVVFIFALGACSHSKQEKDSPADIEAAVRDGRTAAKVFVESQWNDTTELQGLLLEARAKQSKYSGANKKECAAAFDSAFVSTIRTVRPDVARELDKDPNK